jgi:tRNA(fMet)-specific endonuclease VapC
MKYHLDASTIIDIMRFQRESLLNFELANIEDLAMSSVVAHELWAGANTQSAGPRAIATLRLFTSMIDVINFDKQAAEFSGDLVARLNREGVGIGNMDPMIAGHALSQGAVLITRNVKHFKRVPGLQVLDWSNHEG